MSGDPKDTAPEQAKPEQPRCRNCGSELSGRYCSQCGQEHVEDRSRARRLFKEFLRDEFQFNSRMSRTILPLLFQPGFLSQEYLDGKRTRYLPPLRSYMMLSIALFVLVAIGTRSGRLNPHWFRRQTAAETGTTGPGKKAPTTLTFQFPHDTTTVTLDDSLSDRALREKLAAALEREAPDTAAPTMDDRVRQGLVKAVRDPAKFTETVSKTATQAMFVIMPLFALLLKLLYARRKRSYMEHLIFTLHAHDFAFLMIAVILGLRMIGWQPFNVAGTVLTWAIPVYLFLAMKRFYRQRFGKTLAKFLLLCAAYFLLLVPALVAVFAISIVWL
ncbi:MAG TPA: DUF3667 domain-containing protein [Candidatus Edwardsbacteria bacterium]|nr:DUF3667 domain-containing protein [Candidatus Edwardsbacteria bacterium]